MRVKEDKTKELAPEDTWTEQEIVDFKLKNKALNTIMVNLDESQFTLIIDCNQVKQALETLQALYEGDAFIKQSKLQQVHT